MIQLKLNDKNFLYTHIIYCETRNLYIHTYIKYIKCLDNQKGHILHINNMEPEYKNVSKTI